MIWNSQQNNALKAVDKWFYMESKKKQIFRIFGYAGTGKTTLARHFADNIDGDVCYAAFTGKAALMMRQNGCFGATTIHSIIYKPEVDSKGRVTFKLNRSSTIKDASLIIIDECSMVDVELAKDLLSFKVPVLVLGDPAQLPPVKGAGYFTECEPDIMLTEIHRQASENPIIYLATEIRNGRMPDLGTYGESRIIASITKKDAIEADQIIVGRNATRENMNKKMRKLLGIDSMLPIKGDKLICLRNDSQLGIFNGGMFIVDQVFMENKKFEIPFMSMSVDSDDDCGLPTLVKVHKSFFSDEVPVPKDWKVLKESQEFDFGYAITCHKSQGSQWSNVLIYDESWCFRDDWQRWLYTAITRASEKITIVKS
jgi:exodeoxyribonuclease V